jgi:hypothetical protein
VPLRLSFRCDQRWADLEARPGGRFCGRCERLVVDLTRLTRREARERSREGGCFRLRVDERGEAVFRPEPERLGPKALVLAAALGSGCGPAASSGDDALPPDAAAAIDAELPRGVALEELPSVEVVLPQLEENGAPTPEQEMLTRRKHRSPASAPAQSPFVIQPTPPSQRRPWREDVGVIDPWVF